MGEGPTPSEAHYVRRPLAHGPSCDFIDSVSHSGEGAFLSADDARRRADQSAAGAAYGASEQAANERPLGRQQHHAEHGAEQHAADDCADDDRMAGHGLSGANQRADALRRQRLPVPDHGWQSTARPPPTQRSGWLRHWVRRGNARRAIGVDRLHRAA